jgi:triacylglycerol lipase
MSAREEATATLTSSFGLDGTIAAELRSIGAVLDDAVLQRSRALYANRKDLSLPSGGERADDICYGDHPRQLLDVCMPGAQGRPVLLFVPGGGFTGGDKAFYAHVPAFFARRGWLAAAMNYRLAPEFTWPSGAEDVSRALDWLSANATRYGGDASRIYVVGQSAGATHAAGALFDPALRPRSHRAIRKAVLMSGFYRMSADTPAKGATAYFGSDAEAHAARSPLSRVAGSALPVLLTLAEFDPPFLVSSTLAMAQALTERDRVCPPLAWLHGHNHLSPVLGLGGPGDRLGDAIHGALLESA